MSGVVPSDMESAIVFGFIIGTGRCGSTLVHDLLARHPDVGFLSNVDDRLGRSLAGGWWNNVIYRSVPPALTRKGRLRFAPSEGYRILGRRVSPALVAPYRDLLPSDATPWLAGRFAAFFRRHAMLQARPLFLHKFTGWPRVGFIEAALPGARFVHVVRDGRAVANSLVQMPWWDGYGGPSRWSWGPLPPSDRAAWEAAGASFVVLAGLQWKLLMEAFEVAKRAVPADRWCEVRYEDILADPRARIEEILRFLGLSWTPAFERGFRRYAFDAARADAYRQELAPGDIAALEAVLGEHLARFGYPVPVPAEGRVPA